MRILKTLLSFIVLCVLFFLLSCSEEDADTGGISGVVTDISTGEPVRGVIITLSPDGLSKTSGFDGRYEFQDIAAMQYSVQASTQGYKYNVRSVIVKSNQISKCDIHLEPIDDNGGGQAGVFPLEGDFYEKNPSVADHPYFIVSNTSGGYISNIKVDLKLAIGNSGSFEIHLEANQSWYLVNPVNSSWQKNDKVTISVQGKSKIWVHP